jgi:uncharacterized protein (DUF1501 family)
MFHPVIDLGVSSRGVVGRRAFLKQLAGGAAVGAFGLGFRDLMLASAAELRKQGKAMILLWMDGGPSQFDTFNPKPDSPNQGSAKAIDTCLPGVHFAEYWPQTAKIMDKIALIRSMKSNEAEHDRAIALVRTGYPPLAAVRYPTWGSVVAMKRQDPSFDLPAFVRIGKPRIATRDVDSGVLGVKYAAFKIDEAGLLPPDVTPGVSPEVLKRRLALAGKFDAEFAQAGGQASAREKKDVYDAAARFVLSPRMSVFDLGRESDKLRDAYGRTNFGQGCLLARRLIERGVSFVEVISTGSRNDQGWDTHNRGFEDQPPLCAEVDPAYASLLRDLDERGLSEKTLVVWMGEFGRTPKLKSDGGRDHYANGWLAALSGGGIRGGQVIGATNKDGTEVTERPVGVSDLYVSFCKVLGIEPEEEYKTADNRPIQIVEGGKVIKELFS